MYVTRLEVRNWRAIDELVLDLAPGLNILSGPNESGKSSVREALRAAFLFPSSSRGRTAMAAARPWGKSTARPRVDVSFVHGSEEWKLRKVFFAKGSELFHQGHLLVRDDDVHTRVLQTFSDVGFSVLWSIQGDLGLAEVPSDLRPHLAATEAVTPGVTWLQNHVQEMFDIYWTSNRGDARRPLVDARERTFKAESALDHLQAQLREADRISRDAEELDARRLDCLQREQAASTEVELARERMAAWEAYRLMHAECQAMETDSKHVQQWLERWSRQRRNLADLRQRTKVYQLEVVAARERLGAEPSRGPVEQLERRRLYVGARLQDIGFQELRALRAPSATQIEELRALETRLEALGLARKQLTGLDEAGRSIAGMQALLNVLAQREHDLQTVLKLAREDLDRRQRELEAAVRGAQSREERLERGLRRWVEQKDELLTLRSRVDAYEADLKTLEASMGPEPTPQDVEALRQRQREGIAWQQQRWRNELAALRAPETAQVHDLERLCARAELHDQASRQAQKLLTARAELEALRKRLKEREEQERLLDAEVQQQVLQADERDRAQADERRRLEAEVATLQRGLRRWQALQRPLVEALAEHRSYQERLAAANERLAPPDRTALEEVRRRLAYATECQQRLIEEEVEAMKGLDRPRLLELESLLSHVEMIEETLRQVRDLDAQIAAAGAQERDLDAHLEAERVRQAALSTDLAAQDKRDEALQSALEQHERGLQKWIPLRQRLLDLSTRLLAHRADGQRLSQEMGAPPDRADLDALQARRQYCKGRRQQVLARELEALAAPTPEQLAELEQFQTRLQALEAAATVAPAGFSTGAVAAVAIALLAVGVVLGWVVKPDVIGLGAGLGLGLVAAIGAWVAGSSRGTAARKLAEEVKSLAERRDARLAELGLTDYADGRRREQQAHALRAALDGTAPTDEALAELRNRVPDAAVVDAMSAAQLVIELIAMAKRITAEEQRLAEQQRTYEQARARCEQHQREDPESLFQSALESLSDLCAEYPLLSLPTFSTVLKESDVPLADLEAELERLREARTEAAGRLATLREQHEESRRVMGEVSGQLQRHIGVGSGHQARLAAMAGSIKRTVELSGLESVTAETLAAALENDRLQALARRDELLAALGATNLDDARTRLALAESLRARLLPPQERPATVPGFVAPDLATLHLDELQPALQTLREQASGEETRWRDAEQRHSANRAEYDRLLQENPEKVLLGLQEQFRVLAAEEPGLGLDDAVRDVEDGAVAAQVEEKIAALQARLASAGVPSPNVSDAPRRLAELRGELEQLRAEVQQRNGQWEAQREQLATLLPDVDLEAVEGHWGEALTSRDRLLETLAVADLEEARRKLEDARALQARLDPTPPDPSLLAASEAVPEHELEQLPAHIQEADTAWKAARQRHLELRGEYEQKLRENPRPLLEKQPEHFRQLAREYPELALEVPETGSPRWLDEVLGGSVEIRVQADIQRAKAERTDLERQLAAAQGAAPPDEELAAVSEDLARERASLQQAHGLWKAHAARFNGLCESERLALDPVPETPTPLETAIRQAQTDLDEEASKHRGLLSVIGVNSLAEARSREDSARELRARLDDAPPAAEEMETLRAACDDAETVEAMDAAGLAKDLSSLPQRIKEAEARWTAAQRKFVEARTAFEQMLGENPEVALPALIQQFQALAAEYSAITGQVTEETVEDDGLIAPVRDLLEEKQAALEGRRAALTQPTEAEDACQRGLAQAEKSLRETRQSREAVTAVLQLRLGSLDAHADLYSRVARAEEELQRATSDQDKIEREAAVLKLLHDTIEASRQEVETDLVGPLRERIGQRLAQITAGRYHGIKMEPDFKCDTLLTADRTQAPLADVSFGTKEQMAFLSRLCLAEMLSETERNLVVFDDNLVHTDAPRMAVACQVLKEVAEKAQILLLTCHPERFEGLFGSANVIELQKRVRSE